MDPNWRELRFFLSFFHAHGISFHYWLFLVSEFISRFWPFIFIFILYFKFLRSLSLMYVLYVFHILLYIFLQLLYFHDQLFVSYVFLYIFCPFLYINHFFFCNGVLKYKDINHFIHLFNTKLLLMI
mgnify:CR=1 FL=1